MSDGIYQRPGSGFWWASWADRSGTTHRKSTRVKVADDPRGTEARRVRAQLVLAPAVQAFKPIAETWADLLESYLNHLETKIQRSTMTRYEMSLKHLFPVFSESSAAIPVKDVKAYIQGRLRIAKPATINKEIALMQGMYGYAKRELEWDIQNPWEGRTLPTNNERDRWLTPEEVERVAECASPHVADFIRFVANTGLRPGEALHLKWERVDLDAGVLIFRKRKSRIDKEAQKNGKAGMIPLNATARMALMSRKAAIQKARTVTPWVFSMPNGLRIASVRKGFEAACKRAGLENVKPHDLRRTFASNLVQSGVQIQAVSKLLRHSDISVTDRIYAHLRVDDLREATEVLVTPPKLKIVS